MDHVLVDPIVDGGVPFFRGVLREVFQVIRGESALPVHTQWEEVTAEGRFDDGRMVLSGDTNRATSTCTSLRKH